MEVKTHNIIGIPYENPRERTDNICSLEEGDHIAFEETISWEKAIVTKVDHYKEYIKFAYYKDGMICQTENPVAFKTKEFWKLRYNPDPAKDLLRANWEARDIAVSFVGTQMSHKDGQGFTDYCKLNIEELQDGETLTIKVANFKAKHKARLSLKKIFLPNYSKIQEMKKEGLLSEKECKDATITRSLVQTGSVAGPVGGAAVGAVVGGIITGPAAPIGAAVGGAIGAVVGLVVGTGAGIGAAKVVKAARKNKD